MMTNKSFCCSLICRKRISKQWLNPILGEAGGSKFTSSAIYHIKSPESRHKLGIMGYQNSSWDTCDLTKKGFGSKKILGPSPGTRKVGSPENLSISQFGFFYFEQK